MSEIFNNIDKSYKELLEGSKPQATQTENKATQAENKSPVLEKGLKPTSVEEVPVAVNENSIESLVEQYKDIAKVDESGKITNLDNEVDHNVLYALEVELERDRLIAEKEKRETHVATVDIYNKKLLEEFANSFDYNKLDENTQLELDELRDGDQNAFIDKVSQLKKNYVEKKYNRIRENAEKSIQENNKKIFVAKREKQLERFNNRLPEGTNPLTLDVIDNDIPPRMLKELETGKVTFDNFLKKAHKYINQEKKVYKGKEPLNQVNIAKGGGGLIKSVKKNEGYNNILY